MKKRSKIYLIISGILMILTGIIALMSPTATLVSIAWIMGVNTLVSGIMTLCFYFDEARGEIGGSSALFDGIANILFGMLYLCNNILVASILPYLFAMWALFIGIEMIVHCFDWKKVGIRRWWLELLLGILLAILGVLCCVKPVVGAVTISVLVGIAFITRGIADFYILHEMNKVGKKLKTMKSKMEERMRLMEE